MKRYADKCGLLLFCLFCLLLAGMAFATRAYTRAPNFDEGTYYIPAITFVAHGLPHLPVRLYPFPGPPLALWFQAFVFKVFPTLTSARVFSTFFASCLAAYLLLPAIRSRQSAPLGLIAILTFPFFLWNAFTLKQHTFTAFWLLLGLGSWYRAEEEKSRRLLLVAAVSLTIAILSNQFCAPLCLALCLGALLHSWASHRTITPQILAGVLPLLLLGLLMLAWKGMQPPGYLDPMPLASSPGWRGRLAQLSLGTISVGVWVGTLSVENYLTKRWFRLIPIPCFFFIWLSRLYAPTGDFWSLGQGPVSLLLQSFSKITPYLTIALAAVAMAVGLAFCISPCVAPAWKCRTRVFLLAYIGTAVFAVPYLFESYYLLLILPLLFLVTHSGSEIALTGSRASVHFGLMICSGIAYSVFKLGHT